MGEASSYDGYVHHLAAAGVTYINAPTGSVGPTGLTLAAGAVPAPQPWTAAGAGRDPLQGLHFGELDVPPALFDGTVDRYAAGPAALDGTQVGSHMRSAGTDNRHGFAGASYTSQQAGFDPLQAAQQPGRGLPQLQPYQTAQAHALAPASLDGWQEGGPGWPPVAADGYPALVFAGASSRQHASTRSTSAPQLSAQEAYGQHCTMPEPALPHVQASQLSSASRLRAGFLQAPPEVQHRLMQEADLLRQQTWRQQQQRHRLGQLMGDSPQSSPSTGGLDPRLAHATARLSDFDLSSRANSTNSRFSTAETMTSSGSLPPPHLGVPIPPQPAGAPPAGLATRLGFDNPVGVYNALSASQATDIARQPAGPQATGGLAVAGLAEPLQQEQLSDGQWRIQQQVPLTWQQQQQQQPPLPPALSDDALRDWAGISAGMDWELGERQSPVALPDAPQTWQGGALGISTPEVLTRRGSLPSPVVQLPPVVEGVIAIESSVCATSLSLPLHQASAPNISAPHVAVEQHLDRTRSLSPQRTPTKRRSQQRPGRPPKPSAAAVLAAAQASGEAPPLLRQPQRDGQQRGASPVLAAAERAGSSHDSSSHRRAGTSSGVGSDSFPGSLVETAAQLGELHAELEAGHARVQAALAAIHRGWNNELDFRVPPQLAAELEGMGEPERRAHERKERNKQSASAARAKRCEYDAALEALLQAMIREAAFYRTVLREATPDDQLQQHAPAPGAHSSPTEGAGLSTAGSSGSSSGSGRSSGSKRTKKRTARARGRTAAATP